MTRPRPRRDLASTEKASLDDLMTRHPELWRFVGSRLVEAVRGGPAGVEALVRREAEEAAPWRERVACSHSNPEVIASALPKIAAARLAKLAAERALLSAATGLPEGTARFGLWTEANEGAADFTGGIDDRLSTMVLPPELDPAVLVLERRSLPRLPLDPPGVARG